MKKKRKEKKSGALQSRFIFVRGHRGQRDFSCPRNPNSHGLNVMPLWGAW
jgi:hypothetical protein